MIETLNKVDIDKEVKIKKINSEDSLKRRLLDLGFIPGANIKCILVSPFNDPRAYLINNNVIALRNKVALEIEVYNEED